MAKQPYKKVINELLDEIERSEKTSLTSQELFELRQLFHSEWGKATLTNVYNKKNWLKIQDFLIKLAGTVI